MVNNKDAAVGQQRIQGILGRYGRIVRQKMTGELFSFDERVYRVAKL